MASPLQALRSAAVRLLDAARNRERQSQADDPARQLWEQQYRVQREIQEQRARYEAQQRENHAD
jgi:hypothetical protein